MVLCQVNAEWGWGAASWNKMFPFAFRVCSQNKTETHDLDYVADREISIWLSTDEVSHNHNLHVITANKSMLLGCNHLNMECFHTGVGR